MILLLLPLFLSSVSCHPITHEIEVDQANGTDNSSCLLGNNPCATLNKALEGFKMNYSSTAMYLSPGNYTLEHGEVNCITDKDHIAIIGSGETNTIINCKPSAGLYISNCNSTIIESISFFACGYDPNPEVIDYLPEYELKSSAISFSYCRHEIAINFVTIQFSNGTGLLLYNSNGPITVNNSLIAHGYGELPMLLSPDRFVVGGGIVVMYELYDCFDNDHFTIANSKIFNNNYRVVIHANIYQSDCVSLSGGAALTLINPCYSSVHVHSCTIADNTRGFFIYSDDHSTKYKYKNISFENFHNSIVYSKEADIMLTFIDVNMTEHVSFKSSMDHSLHSTIIWEDNRKDVSNHFRFHSWDEICSDQHVYAIGTCYDGNSSFPEDFPWDCPVSYSVCYDAYDEQSYNCSCFDNHKGRLCGECIEGHSVAINSPYLPCVPCDTKEAFRGWGLLVALEFIPVTVMIAVIAVLNVNLNQGSLKAYIFFCQIVTIPFPSIGYPSWLISTINFSYRIIELAFLPFSIWNLGFINYPSCNLFDGSNHCNSMSICISPNTTALEAIAFWYVIGFYPFLLLAFSYVCIIMYDRGYRCIVRVVRPIHRLLARFWGMFNIQPSLPHTIASVYTLCFTQLAATSLKLLTPSVSFENRWNLRFFYDGSQRYFSGCHGAAGTLALIVLIVFIIVPTVYLSLYSFKWFQVIFNKLHFKKDLLISITDVFTGPYKDGTDNNSWDYRYFTGLHFLLQLLIMCIYSMPYLIFEMSLIMISSLCGLSIVILLVFRPYRRNIHTFVEILLFIIFAFFPIFKMVKMLNSDFVPFEFERATVLWWSSRLGGVMYVLLLFVCCYCLFWFLKKSKTGIMYIHRLHSRPIAVNTQTHSDSEQHLDIYTNDDDDDIFADRLLNPQEYGTAVESQPLLT